MAGSQTQMIRRRVFLVRAARGVLGIALVGIAGCSRDDAACYADGAGRGGGSASGLAWSRVDLAYVSAYILVRGDEAGLVDTGYGIGGDTDRIGAVLDAAGPGWAGLRHVVITHAHGDHFGGVDDIADRAPRAQVYAGHRDLFDIEDGVYGFNSQPTRPRLRAVSDGDEVFGLRVVDTPGHTAGHVAMFDADSGVLVAGDALANTIHGLVGPELLVVADKRAANDSVRKLAGLEPRVILVGHGAPVEQDAAARLQSLADSLD